MTQELFQEIGNTKVVHWDVDGYVTVNDYLRDLLLILLEEGECFSGKRPLGNSGWEDALGRSLALAGIVEYELQHYEEDGPLDEDPAQWEIEYDTRADELVNEYIMELFKRLNK